MSTLRTSIQVLDRMSGPMRSMNNAMNIVISSFETMQSVSSNAVDTASIQAARAELNKVGMSISQVEEDIERANKQQEKINGSFRNGSVEASGLAKKVMGFVAAFAGMAAINKGADMTDQYVNQNSRLAMINDGMQTQAELQQKIFQAAQRSRGVYSDTVDTVAKLGLLAKDAFGSNDETIKFAELMNKSFRVSGASAQEASSGMYQLTQALAAGKLQGDEFRSVMENAPMVAQAIAAYTGKSMGQLKEMSSEGTITADIIKGAMFAAADDINGKFESMPKTFGSVMTSMKNQAVMQFSETMQKVNSYLNSDQGTVMIQGITNAMSVLISVVGSMMNMIMMIATFFSSNWGIIEPIIWGIVAAFVAYNAAALVMYAITAAQAIKQGIQTLATIAQTSATWAAAYAQGGLNAALYASPITWIIALIIGLIVVFYAVIGAINKFAGTSISATGVIAGVFMVALAFIGNLFVTLYNLVMDVFAIIWNFIASFVEFFANVFNDPIGSIVRLFSDMADSILQIIEGIASAMDTLFGSNLAGAVSGWREDLQSMTNDLVGEAKITVDRIDPESMHLDRFEYGEAYDAGYKFGEGLDEKFDMSNLFGGVNDATDQLKFAGDTAANTGEMKDSMKASAEDLKYMRDIAEQEVINRFTTAEIKVDMPVNAQISSNMDLDGVVAHLEQKVYETMNVAAEGVSS